MLAVSLLVVVSAAASVVAWANPFPVETCQGVDIKDITVARLQEVRVRLIHIPPYD